MPHRYLSPIEDVIDEARNGRMFILVDDEDRENEGDLIIPASMATPDAVNFMATHGRGLICLTMSRERLEYLDIPMMSNDNQMRHKTAFTVSIEAREGVTTGISAADRAHTVAVAIDPTKTMADLASPGHIFPLMARDGGVLVRAGHTEASVDISRLAGLNSSAVICEIMKDDGTMARLPDLVKYAKKHDLKIATIRDLIAYRLKHDNLVQVVNSTTMNRKGKSEWKVVAYRSSADATESMLLIHGEPDGVEPTLVRMHVINPFEDLLEESTARSGQLSRAMDMIEDAGRGVVVLFTGSHNQSFSNYIDQHTGEAQADKNAVIRNIGFGAQIMIDLGISKMINLTNTSAHIVGLDGWGLEIVENRAISSE